VNLGIICRGKIWVYEEEAGRRKMDETLRNSHSSQNRITIIEPRKVRLEELVAFMGNM
jgi:hypothetical protein